MYGDSEDLIRRQLPGWVVYIQGFPLVVKNLPADAGDSGLVSVIPRSGRSPGGGNGNPLQCSC